tara:strand:+ start:34101 stop:34415 length:315 start_codon:yes stop_codon:yes gene_type:complete
MNNQTDSKDQKEVVFPKVISEVSQRIAPVWPLDTAIAVNPWWPLRDKKFSDVSSNLEALGDVKCLMPKAFYQQHWWKTIKLVESVFGSRRQRVASHRPDKGDES